MKLRPLAVAASLTVLALLGAGCGSSTPSPPVSQATASSGGASPTASPVEKFGPSVLFKGLQGFSYRVSASAIKLVVQVGPLIAPPGQAYLTVAVHVSNATPDRPAPDVIFPFGVVLKAPQADMPTIKPDPYDTNWGCSNDTCYTYADTVSSSGAISGTIPIGGSLDLVLRSHGPVLSTVPLGKITVDIATGLRRAPGDPLPTIVIPTGSQ